MSGPTFTDIFCGAGGSSLGLTEAGLELVLAANHWQRAIDTHSANFREAEHLCADVNSLDMRRLPSTDVLWASPICTEASPAGGVKIKRGQAARIEKEGHVAAAGWERTRATAFDVLRATELHRYKIVLIENVIEFARDWPLFWWWLQAFVLLGYHYKIACVDSAHVGDDTNPYAPQNRRRLYIAFARKPIPLPDLDLQPLAWCFDCDETVHGRQTWKKHTKLGAQGIGKYREQYVYTCPNTSRRHASPIVEPFILPAVEAIDWSDLGTRIGDRKRTAMKPEGLAPQTMTRIRAGASMFSGPMLVRSSGQDKRPDEIRTPYPAATYPLATVTRTRDQGIAFPEPFITMLRGPGNAPTGMDEPLATITTGRNHGLTVPPFYIRNYGGFCDPARTAGRITDPLGTITATGGNHALVIPYRRGRTTTTAEPLHTVATRESAALLHPPLSAADWRDLDVSEWLYRMLKPREHLRAQRFHDSYIVTGNGGEQTMQAGGAVSANVAHWAGRAVMEVL